MKVYVKTTYMPHCLRLPNVSEYDSVEDAERFIRTCLDWGIDIQSCEIVEIRKEHDHEENSRVYID